MRPHQPTSRSRSVAVLRVRALLQQGLGWLRGWPEELESPGRLRWRTAPAPGIDHEPRSLVVDGSVISKATRNRTRLLRQFPRALPRVVGDRELWRRDTERRLERVKRLVNRGEAAPGAAELLAEASIPSGLRRRAEPLAAEGHALEPVLARAAWVCSEGDELDRALAFLVDSTGALERLLARQPGEPGLEAARALCELAVAGHGESLPGLLRLLEDPRAYETRLARAWRSPPFVGSDPLPKPFHKRWWPRGSGDPPARELVAWLPRLLRLEDAARAQVLRLAETLVPARAIDRWTAFWDGASRRAAELGALVRTAQRDISSGTKKVLTRALKEAREELGSNPAAYSLGALLSALAEAGGRSPAERAWLAEASSRLGALPEEHEGRPLRAGLILHWAQLAALGKPRLLVEAVRRTLDLFLSGQDLGRSILPWEDVLRGAGCEPHSWASSSCLDHEFLSGQLAPARLEDLFEAIGICTSSEEVADSGEEELGHLYVLLPLVRRGGLAAEFAASLVAAEVGYMGPGNARVCLALSGGDAGGFCALAAALGEREHEADDGRRAERAASVGGWSDLLAAGVAEQHPRDVLRLFDALAGLETLRSGDGVRLLGEELARAAVAAPPDPEPGRWSRYAAELHPLLEQLEAATPRAPRIAERLLGAAFPEPEGLRAELEGLRRRLEADDVRRPEHLRARVRSIEERLARPLEVSPARMRRLEGKLRRRIAAELLAGPLRALEARCSERAAELLGAPAPLELAADPRIARLLASAMRLKKPYRDLALSLLRARQGPPPWDLREEAPNAAFLERMAARGVRLEPWLEGGEPLRVEGADGRRLELALEADPLEAMRMGEPFGTCLAPGNMNFYSAVLNAADVNKRVLYARDVRGRVQGRCLLALTAGGELLAFHPYHQDGAPSFQEQAGAFVERLAADMGIPVAVRGRVEDLRNGDWYDDGPEDLTGRFRFLDDGSELRAGLAALPAEQLLPRLVELSGQDPPRTGLLAMVVELSELDERPELILPLLPLLHGSEGLQPDGRVRAARLARRAGRPEECRRLLGPLLARRRTWSWEHRSARVAVELVALGDLTAAQAAIRRPRRELRGGWEGEWDGDRLYLAARIQEELGRRRAALRLYRLARERGPEHEIGDWLEDCRQRIVALEGSPA